MTDLTERLAAKLVADDFGPDMARWAAKWSADLLPLLLSEPDLVAGLAPEVRLSVLTPRERAWVNVGARHAAKHAALLAYADPMVGKEGPECDAFVKAGEEFDAALAEARALTPEVPRG